jgi:hypothetical protein
MALKVVKVAETTCSAIEVLEVSRAGSVEHEDMNENRSKASRKRMQASIFQNSMHVTDGWT